MAIQFQASILIGYNVIRLQEHTNLDGISLMKSSLANTLSHISRN